jgi:hypothetical protein
MIREFEHSFAGSVTITYMVGARHRLQSLEVLADMSIYGDRGQIHAVLDLGDSATDRWELDISISDGSFSETVSIVWDYNVNGGVIENRLTIIADDASRPIVFSSSWSPDRGDFRLSYSDRWSNNEITGNFTASSRNFRLLLDNFFPAQSDYLAIEISGEFGANIRRIDFINIDRWDEALFDRLEEFIFSFGMF